MDFTMNVTTETFTLFTDRINKALDVEMKLPESTMDDAAHFILLNSLYASTFESITAGAEKINGNDLAVFMMEFHQDIQWFSNLIGEFEDHVKTISGSAK